MTIDDFLDSAGVPEDGILYFMIWAYDMWNTLYPDLIFTGPLYTIFINQN